MQDVFAPSSTPQMSRVIDYLILKWRLQAVELDATNAFNHVPEDEEVFADPPAEWLEREGREGRSIDVKWQLVKVLYGRRRAGQKWVDWLAEVLSSIGFQRCEEAPQFFYDPTRPCVVEAHMDDMHCGILPGKPYDTFYAEMSAFVKLKSTGPMGVGASYEHLKRKRIRTAKGTWIVPNPKYLENVKKRLGMENCASAPTPSVPDQMRKIDDTPQLEVEGVKDYRSVPGGLMFLGLDREDIQFEDSRLATNLKAPTELSMMKLKRVVRYCEGTKDFAVWLPLPTGPKDEAVVDTFVDSDWAADPAERRSQSSVHVAVDGVPLFGSSCRQATVSQSSGESETYGAARGLADGLLVRQVLQFFGMKVHLRLHSDSAAARGIMRREGVGRIRHLSVRVLWIQQVIKRELAELLTVTSVGNLADLGTKSLPRQRLEELRALCGIKPFVDDSAPVVKPTAASATHVIGLLAKALQEFAAERA